MVNGSVADQRSDEVRGRTIDALKLLQHVLDANPFGTIVNVDEARSELLLAIHHAQSALWALSKVGAKG
jgi:hypothetical protein